MQVDLKEIKLIIWDMDNTFWDGILTEGGIQLNESNIEFLKNLADAGIVNSICSKNNFSDVEKVLTNLGLWDLFVFPSINWETKGTRIKHIIKTMALRPVNVLFLDDDIKNLMQTQDVVPGINIADPSIIPDLIKQCKLLLKSDKDHKRLRQYKVLEEKENAKESFDSNEEFLRNSDISVQMIEEDIGNESKRIAELISRTNQLNYTKWRCDEDTVQSLLSNPQYRNGYVKCYDKYGDYGIVGFYSLYLSENKLVHFLFSCRTMGMGVEQYVYSELGFPLLEVKGDIVTKLDKSTPNWINMESRNREKIEENRKERILFIGPCDISQTAQYLRGGYDSSFAYVSTEKNTYIEEHNHTDAIIRVGKYSHEQKEYLKRNIPFIDEEYFSNKLYKKKYDIVVLSMLTDYGLTRYQCISDPQIRIACAQAPTDLTDEAMWDKLHDLYHNPLDRDFLLWFKQNFKCIGRITPKEMIENLSVIADSLPNSTKLVLLNGSEYPYPGIVKFAPYNKREQIHIDYNEYLAEFAKTKKNCYLIDVNRFLNSDAFLDTINHYKKHVYWEIAQELSQILSSENITSISYFEMKLRSAFENLLLLRHKTKIVLLGFLKKDFK